MKKVLFSLLAGVSSLVTALAFPIAAKAASTVVVTPANQQGWTTADTKPGGSVNYVFDSTSPAPNGALQLLTDNTTTSQAQYMHPTATALSSINELSYYTKQLTPSGAVADPSYQLATCLNGAPNSTTCNGFTTLVYEPYQGGQGAIVNNTWQQWNIANGGLFWSTHQVTCTPTNTVIAGTSGGPATYTLAALQAACPNALVFSFGVNVGSNNPDYNVETDLVDFNGTTYNFELNNTPTDKNDCKNGGFANFTDENGNAFKNQGQCVAFVNRGSTVKHKNINTVNVHNNNNQTASSGNANSNHNSTGGNATSGNASNSNSNSNTVRVNNNPTF